MGKKSLDERLAGLGMPDDFTEVALDGVPPLSLETLERIENRTLEKVAAHQMQPTPHLAIVKKKETKFMIIKIAAASLLVASVAGVAALFDLNSSQTPLPGNQPGPVVQHPAPNTPPVGKGGDALDLPPQTGDAETDANANLRQFYSWLNEQNFGTADRLFYLNNSQDAGALNMKGVTGYAYKGGTLVRMEPDARSPGDTILMKIEVTVLSDGQIDSPIYKAGENTLEVQMGKVGDGTWMIKHFVALDGKVWPVVKSGGCVTPADQVPKTLDPSVKWVPDACK
jgi:hypothetical protein